MSAPEPQPERCLPTYRQDVRQDKPGPVVHRHHRPSAPQAPRPPSPHCAACRSPRDHPGIHPTRAENAPDRWHVRSIRDTSATLHPAPPRWRMVFVPPVPRTVHVHTPRADNHSSLHSTASTPDDARPQARRRDLAPLSPVHGQAHRQDPQAHSPGKCISVPEPMAAVSVLLSRNQTQHRLQKHQADNSYSHVLKSSLSHPTPSFRQILLSGRYTGN